MALDLPQVLAIVTVFQCLLFSLFLYRHQKGNRLANRLLATILLLLAGAFADGLLDDTGVYLRFPHLAFVLNSFGFEVPPLLYLFARALARPHPRLSWRDAVHGAPIGIVLAYSAFIYHSRSAEEKLRLLQDPGFGARPGNILIMLFGHALFVGYLAATLVLIHRYAVQLRSFFSTVEDLSLRWLRMVLVGIVGLWATALGYLVIVVRNVESPGVQWAWMLVQDAAVFLFVNVLVYRTLHQPELLTDVGAFPEQRPRYERSGLAGDAAEQHLKKLLLYMEVEKPYRSPQLTLEVLAGASGMPPRHLSQIINESLSKNFFDFVNSYRVEDVKRMLLDPRNQDRPVLDLALEAGFSSKSSFNSAFRKCTGTTPSAWRRQGTG